MDMFTNFNATPSTYIPNNINKKPPQLGTYPPVKPLEEYNAKGELIGYYWMYGDNVVLNFTLSGDVTYDSSAYRESIATYMSNGKQELHFNIYNFRYECIYTANPVYHCNEDGTVNVAIFIYDDLSKAMVKGRYFIDLSIVSTLDNPLYDESDPNSKKEITIKQTIFKPDDCVILVK